MKKNRRNRTKKYVGNIPLVFLISIALFFAAACEKDELVVQESNISEEELKEIFIAQERGGSEWEEMKALYKLDSRENWEEYTNGLNNLKLDKEAYYKFLHKAYLEYVKTPTALEGLYEEDEYYEEESNRYYYRDRYYDDDYDDDDNDSININININKKYKQPKKRTNTKKPTTNRTN